MKQTSTIKLFLVIMLIITSIRESISQVTIGNAEPPVLGSLLQLKNIDGVTDGSANSTKGITMPRVELTDPSSLQDINIGASDTPSDYIGLVVYNTQLSSKLCPGLYVWTGDKWEPISEYKCFYVEADPKTINFAIDETQKTAILRWAPSSSILSFNKQDLGSTGGLRNLTYTTSTGGEAVLTITAQAMTTAETVATPIIDRATRLDIINTLPSGDIAKESIMLYQKNSGVDASKGAKPLACSYYMDGSTYSFSMITAGDWDVVIKSDPGNIISSIAKTSGTANLVGDYFEFTLIDDVTTPSLYMADAVLTFKSPNGEFADQDITIKGVSYWLLGDLVVDYADVTDRLKNVEVHCASKGMRVAMPNDFTYMYQYRSIWPCHLNMTWGWVATGDFFDCYDHDGGPMTCGTLFNNVTGYFGDTQGQAYPGFGGPTGGFGNYSDAFRCVKNK